MIERAARILAVAVLIGVSQHAFAWCASGYDEYPDPYDANAKICVKHGNPPPSDPQVGSQTNTNSNANANANNNTAVNTTTVSNSAEGGKGGNATGGTGIGVGVGGQGGQGGQGGAGGQGGKGGSATGGNANATGGSISHSGNSHSTSSAFNSQSQNQSQSVDNSGNSHSSSSTDSHNVTSNALTNSGGNSSNSNTNTSAASNNGSNVTVQGSTYEAQERNPVNTAYAPTVINGSDQCLTTVSVGAQGVMFGLAFGSAKRDEICELMKLSDRLKYLGLTTAAVELLAQDDRVRKALDAVGYAKHGPAPTIVEEPKVGSTTIVVPPPQPAPSPFNKTSEDGQGYTGRLLSCAGSGCQPGE